MTLTLLCAYRLTLFLTWILILIDQVWSDELAPPQDVHLDSELRWTPTTQHSGRVKYTAQYLTFDGPGWTNVPGCEQTNLTSCNISSISFPTRRPCVMLRVQAVDGLHSSRHVQAYSHDKSCSPVFTLTPLPGALTIHMGNNSLLYDISYALYSINLMRNGRVRQITDVSNSKTINDLEVGEHVCVEVQYSLLGKRYGPPSKQQCTLIPESEKDRQNNIVIICVTVVVLVALVLTATAYIIITKYEDIKRLLQPPIRIPDHLEVFISQSHSQPSQTLTTSDAEESYDRLFTE